MVILTGHLRALLIVLILALVIFGPKRIPEIGSSLGRGIRDFRRGMSQLGDEVMPPEDHQEPRPISSVLPDQKAG
jgi:sec-independent protein translocase protein TatA